MDQQIRNRYYGYLTRNTIHLNTETCVFQRILLIHHCLIGLGLHANVGQPSQNTSGTVTKYCRSKPIQPTNKNRRTSRHYQTAISPSRLFLNASRESYYNGGIYYSSENWLRIGPKGAPLMFTVTWRYYVKVERSVRELSWERQVVDEVAYLES